MGRCFEAHFSFFSPSQTASHRYLDSVELHSWLTELMPVLHSRGLFSESPHAAALGGPPSPPPPPRGLPGGVRLPGGSKRILPVFLFDIAREDILLFDKEHQSVAFPGMVVAARSHAGESPFRDFVCSRGGLGARPALMNSHELTRPVLGALLEAGWGVVPTHKARSASSEPHFLQKRNVPTCSASSLSLESLEKNTTLRRCGAMHRGSSY